MKQPSSIAASIGLFVAVSGVSISSIFVGAQTVPYYGSIVLGALLCIPHFYNRFSAQEDRLRLRQSGFLALPMIIFVAQEYVFESGLHYESAVLPTLALSVIMFLAITFSMLPNGHFENTMSAIALLHIGLLILSLHERAWIATKAFEYDMSLSGSRQAVWAELGMGVVLAAFLGRRIIIIAASVIIGSLVIILMQMRGIGLAVVSFFFVVLWSYSLAAGPLLFFHCRGRYRPLLHFMDRRDQFCNEGHVSLG